MSNVVVRRKVTPEDLALIEQETREFNYARDPRSMCEHIGRIVALAPTDTTIRTLGVMAKKAEFVTSDYEDEWALAAPVHSFGISLGAQTTAHMMALGLDASPLSTYLAEIEKVRGARALALPEAKMCLSAEIDALMHQGEVETARTLYLLAAEIELHRPVVWTLTRGAYRIAGALRRSRNSLK